MDRWQHTEGETNPGLKLGRDEEEMIGLMKNE